jgi:hypothetical protein
MNLMVAVSRLLRTFGNTVAHLRHHTQNCVGVNSQDKSSNVGAATDGSHAENNDSVDSASLIFIIQAELTDENIDSFVDLVEGIYKQSFESQYKFFTIINNYLVERKHIKTMYQSLVDLFPHSVLALTLSHLWYGAVKLSSQMSLDDDAESDSDSDIKEDNTLTKHQRAILEFFIAKLHLRSQKNMRHWAISMPLPCHSRGHVSAPASHPLHGAGCSHHVLWKSLNELFD